MFSFRRSAPAPNTAGVGWVLAPEWEATIIWGAPRKLDDHLFELLAPVDLHFRAGRNKQGEPALLSLDGDDSSIRLPYLNKLAKIMPQAEWRHANRPMFQVATPYYFVADEPVYVTSLPPFHSFAERPLPGLILGGRFPIHIWPRQMIWAFEWYDPAKDLFISRGDPWLNLSFETQDPSRPVDLVEAEMTETLRAYLLELRNVTSYVNKTFSLFKTAEQRRPQKLLTPKRRIS